MQKGREGKGGEGRGGEGRVLVQWDGTFGGEGGVGGGACNPCCLSLRALADTVSQMS